MVYGEEPLEVLKRSLAHAVYCNRALLVSGKCTDLTIKIRHYSAILDEFLKHLTQKLKHGQYKIILVHAEFAYVSLRFIGIIRNKHAAPKPRTGKGKVNMKKRFD